MKKRRLLSAIITFTMVVSMIPAIVVPAAAASPSGSWDKAGNYTPVTEKNLKISTAAELAGFAVLVNSGADFSGYTVSLAKNIDLSAHYWVPIGTFSGTFDGNGHTITGLNVYNGGGLFGQILSGTVTGLNLSSAHITIDTGFTGGISAGVLASMIILSTVENCSVSGTVISGTEHQNYAGGFAGLITASSIDGCSADCSVSCTSDALTAWLGGFSGAIGTEEPYLCCITDCTSDGAVTVVCTSCTESTAAGGFVAYAYSSSFSGCSSGADVSVNTGAENIYAGGFAGKDEACTVEECGASGDVFAGAGFGSSGDYVGIGGFVGLVAYTASESSIASCSGSGSVSGRIYDDGDYLCAGGFAGINYCELTQCASTGAVGDSLESKGSGLLYAGGFVGSNMGSGSIIQCRSVGQVSDISCESGDVNVGGFTGINYGTIRLSETYSDISSVENNDGNCYIGGFAGISSGLLADAAIFNCYNVNEICSSGITGSGYIGCAGFVYNNKADSSIGNCYCATDIHDIDSTCVGFVYSSGGDIVYSYYYRKEGSAPNAAATVIKLTEDQLTGENVIGYGTYSTYSIVDALNAVSSMAGRNRWTSGAGKNSGYPILAYKVSFESNGGSAVDSVVTDYDSTIDEPNAPARSGYAFDGWYSNSSLTDGWDFGSDIIDDNLTLYAGWTATASSAPVLSKVSVTRTGKSSATVRFSSSASGTYYYKIIPCGYTAPVVSTSGTGISMASGTNTVSLTSLGARGAYYIYIAGKNASGTGEVLRMTVPYYDDGVVTDITAVFSDITSTHWAFDYIQTLYDDGLFEGYDGEALPDTAISRGDVIRMIVLSLGLEPADTVTMSFDDVGEIPDDIIGYVQTSVDEGIIIGNSLNMVNVTDSITRNETAVILQRAFGLVNSSDAAESFNDAVPSWAADSVSSAVDAGAINGYPGNYFYGTNLLTNSQIIKIIYMLM